MADVSRAMINPAAVFQHPQEVVEHPRLTREQQSEILRRWAYDACAMEVAEEENMTSPYNSGLEQIMQALHILGVESRSECAAPTKHGGL